MRQILTFSRNLLIVLGIALLLVSFILNPGLAENTDVVAEPDNWGGFLLSMGGPLTLTAAEETGKQFSLYILTFQDAIMALQESSANHTYPFLIRENITFFSETIPIVIPGIYGILISPIENETIAVGIVVGRLLPQLGFIVYGAFLITMSVSLEVIRRLYRARKSVAI